VPDDRKGGPDDEPQRVLGIPAEFFRPRNRDGEEPQRVLGVPVDFFGPGPEGNAGRRALAHPVRAYRRWARRRHSGPDAADPGAAGKDRQ
jgi:hypothetical protein